MSAARRDISPLLSKMRNFLLGRSHTNALRFEDDIAARTQAPPQIPDGPAHKLSTNYYHARDARRDVAPPNNLMQKQIAAGTTGAATPRIPTPGKAYRWD